MTIVALMDVRSITNYTQIISKEGTTTSNIPYELRLGATGPNDPSLILFRANANATGHHTTSVVGSIASKVVYAVSSASGLIEAIPNAYIGKSKEVVSTADGSNTGVCTDNGAAVWIGRRSDGATQLDGRIYYIALFNRQLSDAEVLSFTDYNWQVFQAPQQPLYAVAAAAGVNGALGWLEQNDTSAITGSVKVTAAASWTEASDTTSIAASVKVTTAAAWTEASDSTAITGAATVTGSATLTEASDSANLAATAQVNAAASWTEASDTAAIAGLVGNGVTASAVWTEQSDTATITAAATVTSAAAWTEASDSTNIAASVGNSVAGNAAWTEQNDTTAASATVRVNAAAGWAEASDLSGFSAQVLATAGIAWTETSDSTHATAFVGTPSGLIPNPARTAVGRARIRSAVGTSGRRTATWTH
ncbi:MAG: hypothetical protein JWR21_893 [Herminiimonas sp.]|nr:hypothetical protein [Herminiimonas sp.]